MFRTVLQAIRQMHQNTLQIEKWKSSKDRGIFIVIRELELKGFLLLLKFRRQRGRKERKVQTMKNNKIHSKWYGM